MPRERAVQANLTGGNMSDHDKTDESMALQHAFELDQGGPIDVEKAYIFLNTVICENAADDSHVYEVLRTFLMSVETYDVDYFDLEIRSSLGVQGIRDIKKAVEVLVDDGIYGREYLTSLRLAYSLCPLHAVDYAICFDDDVEECAVIRIIHPGHDT
jgi:hypothetical protein